MRIGKKSFAALAAASMLIAPVAAQAAPTAKSTASVKRAGADRKSENKLEGTAAILAALAAAAIVAGIVIVASDEDNKPTSP